MDLNNYGPGRPPSEEVKAILQRMVETIKEEPGIPSARLATLVGLSSLQCAMLARRLKKRGLINIGKRDSMLVYTAVN